jgi:hypothetical protein
VLGFLVALPFVSLDKLWSTRIAAKLLLWSAAILIFLINAAYQDARQSRLKFFFVAVASAELAPLVGLAAWAIALRVDQHGWTTDRIFATVITAILLCYAAGYVFAVAGWSGWQRRFETANVLTAYVILATILALFSPLADPSRLMVADQLARLKSGSVEAAEFDYRALLQDGARWGKAALEELSEAKDIANAQKVNEMARLALAGKGQPSRSPSIRKLPQRVELTAGLVSVIPAGRELPESFFSSDKGAYRKGSPSCAQPTPSRKCLATFIAPKDGGPEAVVFFDIYAARLFVQNEEGSWEGAGNLQGRWACKIVQQAAEAGMLALEDHQWPDLLIGGERLTIVPQPTLGPCK